MADPELTQAISDAELLRWCNFCDRLKEMILLARLAGKPVKADVWPEYVVPNWSVCGLATGRMRVEVVI